MKIPDMTFAGHPRRDIHRSRGRMVFREERLEGVAAGPQRHQGNRGST